MIDSLISLIQQFLAKVVFLFPSSPFSDFIDTFQAPEYLGWLNWFFPVSDCLAILVGWLTVVALFYLYSIAARWLKILGD